MPYSSPGLEQIYGLRPDEVVADASPLFARIHPDDVDHVSQTITASAADLSQWRCEFRVRHPTRGELWVEGSSCPEREPDGGVLWHGIIMDVTERKRAEQTLRDQASLLELSFDAVVVRDLDGPIRFWNQGATALYGFSAEQARGRSIHELLRTWRTPGLEPDADALRRTGAWSGVLRQVTRGGETIEVESRQRATTDADGGLLVFETNRDVTARRRAERAAWDSGQRLSGVLDSAMDGIVTLDEQRRVTLFNHAAEDMFGYRAADVLGLPLDRLLPERFRDGHRASVESYAQAGTTRRKVGESGTIVGLRASGEEFPIEASLTRTQVGGRTVVTAILRDVTARLRAEAHLRSSEERFAKAFRSSPVPLVITRIADGCFVEVNEAFERLSGHSRPELLGRTSLEIGLWARLEERDEMVRQLGEQGTVRNLEVAFRTKSGDVRDVLLSAEGLELDGAPHGLGIAIDITERKRADEALRATEQRFRDLAENIREVFWLTVPDKSRMLYVSPGYEAIWGRSCQSLYDSPADWAEAIHPDDRARVMQAAQTDQVPGKYEEQYRIVRPDGSVRWIRDQAFPVRDATGQVIRIAGVAEDVTERLRLEEQLRHAQKMESVGQLAGGVAHDFNNVLTVISASNDVLRYSLAPGDDRKELVDEIQAAVLRAGALTRQLLAFSRQQVIEPRVLDLNEVVTDTDKMLRRLLGEDVLLTTALGHGLPQVTVDPGHLVQVLMNLAVNARDAMPRGGRLTIETQEAEVDEAYAQDHPPMRGGRYVMLAVTDTGTGMPPEVLARVFEPFFTTKGVGKGTGMGLAVVHGIVTQSGGHVAVYSEVGIGTTFKVYLPATPRPAAALRNEATSAVARGAETLLLVEDDNAVRRVGARALRAHGYTVLEAAGGEEALAILTERGAEIQLLITDVVMPGLDGREVAEAAARIAPSLKVLYTSGYTDDAVVRHGVLHAEVAFLQKPFTPAGLAQKVRQVLDRR